ncbi:hypothetical protein [Streptomyces sp. NPDC003697]
MLSNKSRPVITATLPVVADHIHEIAQRLRGEGGGPDGEMSALLHD